MAFKKKWNNPTQCKTYFAWRSMRSRCMNPNDPSYANYGERGIKVCQRWAEDYDAFFADMGEAPDGLSIERINVDGDYEPSNCRWADWTDQANNKRTNKIISYGGRQMTAAQWARELGIGPDTLHRRINVYQMPLEKALTKGSLARLWRHGTRQGYVNGCKCKGCKAAHADHHREMRAKRKLLKMGEHQ